MKRRKNNENPAFWISGWFKVINCYQCRYSRKARQ